MEQVADNTYRLGSKGHNYYVLRDGDAATIVDAGCSGEWSKLVNGLGSIGLSVESVAGIVFTHAHADHFGLAKKASEEGLSLSVHEDEETRALGKYQGRFSAGATDLPLLSLTTFRHFLPMILAGVMKLSFVDQVDTFTDGRTDRPSWESDGDSYSGHTEGHVMFHCPDRGILFSGDGVITMDLIGKAKGPQMIEKRFNLDNAQALASLDRIVDLEAELLLPGHGEPWKASLPRGRPRSGLGHDQLFRLKLK